MKVWWKSKTIWFNAAAGGVGFIAAGWDQYAGTLPHWAAPLLGGLVMAANVGLRFITTDPVCLKQMDPDR